ncbi:MAG: hypothetical protein KDC38_15045 [Planctomycetes bacterium]|nr:hypothetical protein [Planctomycetota bacterium]
MPTMTRCFSWTSFVSWVSVFSKLSIVLIPVLVASATGSTARADEPTVFDGLKLPKPGYAKAVASCDPVEFEADGLDVTISVIPDLFIYEMAVGLEEIHKMAYTGDRLESEVKKLYAKAKKQRGNAAFHVKFVDGAHDVYFFLSNKIDKHVKVSGGARKTGKVTEMKPDYRFITWTVMQGAASRKLKMMRYEELEFVFPIKMAKEAEPVEIQFENLVRYHDLPKKSEYEYKGINLDAKQISLGNFKDLEHQPFGKTFYPGKWKLPKAPEGFDELIAHLEAEK